MSLEQNKLSAALYFHRNQAQVALPNSEHYKFMGTVPHCSTNGREGAFGEEVGGRKKLRKPPVAQKTAHSSSNINNNKLNYILKKQISGLLKNSVRELSGS